MLYHWGYTSIYRPLSYPLRSLSFVTDSCRQDVNIYLTCSRISCKEDLPIIQSDRKHATCRGKISVLHKDYLFVSKKSEDSKMPMIDQYEIVSQNLYFGVKAFLTVKG